MIEYVMSVRYLLMGQGALGNTHTCSRAICMGMVVVVVATLPALDPLSPL